MREYISREAAINKLLQCADDYNPDYSDITVAHAVSKIKEISAADAVDVVRCKDCKYGVPTKNGFLNDMIACENEDSPCGYSSWLCQPDWFCADGERREVQDGAET